MLGLYRFWPRFFVHVPLFFCSRSTIPRIPGQDFLYTFLGHPWQCSVSSSRCFLSKWLLGSISSAPALAGRARFFCTRSSVRKICPQAFRKMQLFRLRGPRFFVHVPRIFLVIPYCRFSFLIWYLRNLFSRLLNRFPLLSVNLFRDR